MQPAGLQMVAIAKEKGTWDKAYLPASQMTIPDDFMILLNKKVNKDAKVFFETFNKTNRYAVGFRLAVMIDPKKREIKMETFIKQFKNKKYFHPQ